MKRLRTVLTYFTLGLIAFLSHNSAAVPLGYAAELCPSGFQLAYTEDLNTSWNVCIESSLYAYNDVKEEENSVKTCPLISAGDVLQAWNPEAGVCFSLANTPTDEQIFSVTRDLTKNRVLVDLFESKEAAACVPGSGEAYLLSPAEVYCLKDIQTEPYGTIEIDGDIEDYFQRLLACKLHSERELKGIEIYYQQYLEFAYYRNPNIEIRFNSTRQVTKNSSHQTPIQGVDDIKIAKDDCGTPNVSRMIGITN